MGIRTKFLLLLATVAIVVGGVMHWKITSSHAELIRLDAERIARIVTSQVLADRAIYTAELVGKLKEDGVGAARDSHERPGFIQLPAQFVRSVSQRVEETAGDLYRYRLISQWNLNEDQGIKDEFDRWAWAQLMEQDARNRESGDPTDTGYQWTSVSMVEEVDGAEVLHYLRADPASAEACVSCHNGYEQREDVMAMRVSQNVEPGKQWNRHELMGAIRVDIPLSVVQAAAADSERSLYVSLTIILVFGFGSLLLLLYWAVIRPVENSVHEVGMFKALVDKVVSQTRSLLDGTDTQLDSIESGDTTDMEQIRSIALDNTSNAQLAAASCSELDDGFNALNGKLRRMLGRKK